MIYVRYHTRTIYYYGGITQIMPIFSTFFLFFTMAFTFSVNSLYFLEKLTMSSRESEWIIITIPSAGEALIVETLFIF